MNKRIHIFLKLTVITKVINKYNFSDQLSWTSIQNTVKNETPLIKRMFKVEKCCCYKMNTFLQFLTRWILLHYRRL